MNHFNKLSSLALLAFTLSTTSACTVATPIDDVTSTDPVAVGSIQGRVMTLSGMPVVAADVEAGGDAGSTDSQGYFSLTHVTAGTDVDVIVQSERYSSGRTRIALAAHQEQTVLLTVAPADLEILDDAAAGGTVVAPSGVEIIFPPNSIVDAVGNPVSGAIEVKTALIDEYHEAAAAPGSSMGPTLGAGSELGMVEVELTQNGAPVELSTDVELRLPLQAGTAYVDGDIVDLRHFDEDRAAWTAEGSGFIDAGMFVASVGHFSWWWYNGYPGGIWIANPDSSCICGTAVTPSGTPLVGGTVLASGENHWGGGSSQIDANGDFCITLGINNLVYPLTNTLKIWGSDANGDFFETDLTGQQTGTVPTNCSQGTGSCVDIGTQTLAPTAFTCIQGTLTGDWVQGLEINWYAGFGDPSLPLTETYFDRSEGVPAGGDFCISVPSAPVGSNGFTSNWSVYVEQGFASDPNGPFTSGGTCDSGANGFYGTHTGATGSCDLGTCMDIGLLDVSCAP